MLDFFFLISTAVFFRKGNACVYNPKKELTDTHFIRKERKGLLIKLILQNANKPAHTDTVLGTQWDRIEHKKLTNLKKGRVLYSIGHF